MIPKLEAALAKGAVVLDGGMGTEFQRRGVPAGTHPDLLNLTHPEIVKAVIKSYAEAGADVLLTNTFGASRFVLEKHDALDKLKDVNRRAAEIALEVASESERDVCVLGDLGPTGVILALGQVDEREIYDAYAEQIAIMKEVGVDGVVLETQSDPNETVQGVKAAKDLGMFVAASAVFDSGKNKDRTMTGATPEKFVQAVEEVGADVVGSNCGRGIDGFAPICERMRAVTKLPIAMKANAGLPQMVDGKLTYAQTPEAFADAALKLIELGANFVGGCCGTNPDFIAAIRRRIG